MKRQQADMFIKVVTELEGKFPTSGSIGLGVLYEIATLPPDERNSEHTTFKGETKTPDEMTVKDVETFQRLEMTEISVRMEKWSTSTTLGIRNTLRHVV